MDDVLTELRSERARAMIYPVASTIRWLHFYLAKRVTCGAQGVLVVDAIRSLERSEKILRGMRKFDPTGL